jgi:hypothetical protein
MKKATARAIAPRAFAAPHSYEAQRVFAMALDRLNEPEYSMNEEGDGSQAAGQSEKPGNARQTTAATYQPTARERPGSQ